MRVLLDTNVALDYLLRRPPFFAEARTIWLAARSGAFEPYVSGITPVNVFYVARKVHGAQIAARIVGLLARTVHVSPIDDAVIQAALVSPLRDFEDAVQVASAVAAGLDLIVTRDVNDFRGATLPVFTPGAFIARKFT